MIILQKSEINFQNMQNKKKSKKPNYMMYISIKMNLTLNKIVMITKKMKI